MTITLYVAGATAELKDGRPQRMMAAARELGYTVVSDWPEQIAKRNGDLQGITLTRDERVTIARCCLRAAVGADIFWFLHPRPGIHTSGAWGEFCVVDYAFDETAGFNAPAVSLISYAQPQIPENRSLFTALADYEFAQDETALDWLQTYRDGSADVAG